MPRSSRFAWRERADEEPLAVGIATRCLHTRVEPVTADFDDRPVALLCVDCGDALPPSWGCPRCVWVDTPRRDGDFRRFALRDDCGDHLSERLVDDLEDAD